MAPVGIVVACLPEATCLARDAVPDRTLEIAEGVLLRVSGIGPARATAAAEALAAAGVAGLISFGTAGGLARGIAPGTLVLPGQVATASGLLTTHGPWREHLTRHFVGASVTLATQDMVEAQGVVATTEDKGALAARHGAIAVDMESGAVLRVAQGRQLPAVVMRVIMDDHATAMPPFLLRHTDTYGRSHLPGLLGDLLRHPSRLGPLMRVSRTFASARSTMRLLGGQLHLLHPGHDVLPPPR